ncbi:hypothetical protein, partial [Xanthomonas oryzae]|uniref:hypothetical protein n=1 Tax=Xanthomonas oryzae TaxID=347 RepID=UPI001B873014
MDRKLSSGCRSSMRKIGTSPYLVAPEKPSQTPNAMFGGHMMLEHVEGRARTTCNQARKKAIQR